MQAFSERLGVLSRDQLQAALDRFDLGALLDAQPTASGLFGQNVFLRAESGEWVFRGAPHWPWQFAKEQYFAGLLRCETAAPVAWPYLVEASEDTFGWSYALMPRLPGRPPSEICDGLGADDIRQIARAMGAGLAELQRLTAPEPGEYDPETGGVRGEASFADWVLSSLREWRAKALEVPGALDAADLAVIEEVVASTRDALAEPFEPCFIHCDYKEGNVLVDRREGGWELSGVFDLMTCAFGDGEQDLSRAAAGFADPEAARGFISAYRERRPLRPGHRERFRIYMLMDRLVLWEYGRRNRIWFPEAARFRDFARRFLSLDGLLAE